VEEQFYFVWPFVVFLVPPRWLLRSLIGLELAEIVGRAWWVFHHGGGHVEYMATLTRLDGLVLGAACAVAVRQVRFPRRAVVLLPWMAAFCVALYVAGAEFAATRSDTTYNFYYGLPLLAVGFASFVLGAALTDTERTWLQSFLRWKPLMRFGKYAYGIYVFHVPAFYFVDALIDPALGATHRPIWFHYSVMLMKFAVSYGIAALSYNFFEKRFLALKGRFEPETPVVETRFYLAQNT
jgi:peptidoglycan/LPS O-acetylase OafA/YrhL